uniref:AAA+ ATPase domain-containing protein n=1 Tax=Oryza rufipogon TaxID=4529 RepID=A0A0E0NP83_ORYRU
MWQRDKHRNRQTRISTQQRHQPPVLPPTPALRPPPVTRPSPRPAATTDQMAAAPSRCLLVTGPPGVGKTTLVTRVFETLRESHPHLNIRGFYTREVRESGERVGFEVVTLDGRTGPLASSKVSSRESVRWPTVGRYKVDIASLESLALPELQVKDDTDLFIIDEVGKMELFSSAFFPAVMRVIESNIPVLATIPVPRLGRDIPGVARLRNHPGAVIYTLNTGNRDAMREGVYNHLSSLLQKRQCVEELNGIDSMGSPTMNAVRIMSRRRSNMKKHVSFKLNKLIKPPPLDLISISIRYPNIAIAAYCWISLATSATMLQYLDFSHASTSRKWSHKKQGEGFEAPRNSMEFTLEAPQSYGVFQEDVPYSCNMRQQYPKAGLNHSSSPIKRIIHEDVSFRTNEVQKRPSVIARLMGMDSPPMSTTAGELAAGHTEEKRQDMITSTRPMPRRDPSEMVSTKHVSFVQHKGSMKHSPKQAEVCAYDDSMELFGQLSKAISSSEWAKPQPREHPQEEELQKFKKDFEAWQASRMWEQSRALELESHLDDDDVRCTDIVPYRFQHRGKDNAGKKHTHSNGDAHWRRSKESGTGTGTSISGSRTFSLTSADASSTRLPLSRFYYEEERLLSPKKIVILKPCPEMSTDDIEESSLGSPEMVKKENNMEAFLEEVKKRLKVELEGRMASDDRAADRWAAGGDIPADPKQIARSIANQIRETVTKDLHSALLRSESTRSYRSDIPLNGQSQMDYICRDARKHLSDRLKNVLRREPETEPPALSHRRRTASASFNEEPRPKPRHEVARKGKIRSKEEKKHAIEFDVRSFRRGHHKASPTPAIDSDPVSPRNLVRSFSAPVSGTTFVKLLSEEPRVLTGARLQRKQEGYGSRPPPPSSEEERKGRKDTFNIKGRVSNLRQNLGLRAKLFGKKLHSADESPFPDDLPPIGTLVTAPSVLIHPGVLQENSTEVPPSPASWCSSPPDEMSRGGYPSPVSPLEASFSEHRSPLKMAARDMSSSASEPEHPSSEQAQTDQELAETSPIQDDDDDDTDEIDNPIKAYIRAILVIAGLYGQRRSSDQLFSDREVKPIPAWVFEEVESSSSSSAPATTDCDAAATGVDHRLLFDLINESLPRVVQSSTTLCAFSRWYGAAPRRSPGGKRLLDGLWNTVQAWLAPPPPTDSPNSVDELIGRDMSMSPWNGPFREDVGAAGAEMEAEILDELVDETLWDVLLNVGD